MPRLSVLMSAYRAEDTIALAARSVLRGMPSDSELVVVVDGPGQEPTAAVLETIPDNRLRVIHSDVNLGLARQLSNLVEATDSEYIGRMDSDDVSLPWRFRFSLPRLNSSDFVFTSGIRFGPKHFPRPSYPLSLNSYEVARALLFTTPLFHPSMVARRSSLVGAGGYRPLPYGEDHELWVRAAAAGFRIEKLAAPGVAYRISPTQMSQTNGGHAKLEKDPDYIESFRLLADLLGVRSVIDEETGGIRPVLQQSELDALVVGCRRQQRHYIARHARSAIVGA